MASFFELFLHLPFAKLVLAVVQELLVLQRAHPLPLASLDVRLRHDHAENTPRVRAALVALPVGPGISVILQVIRPWDVQIIGFIER